MSKTKRDLLHAAADKIGGTFAEKLRTALAKNTLVDDLIDRPMNDEEFAAELKRIETELPKALARMERWMASGQWPKSGEWGLN